MQDNIYITYYAHKTTHFFGLHQINVLSESFIFEFRRYIFIEQ